MAAAATVVALTVLSGVLVHGSQHRRAQAGDSSSVAAGITANTAAVLGQNWVLRTKAVNGGSPSSVDSVQTFRLGSDNYVFTDPTCDIPLEAGHVTGSSITIRTKFTKAEDKDSACALGPRSPGLGYLTPGTWTWQAEADTLTLTDDTTKLVYDHGDAPSSLIDTRWRVLNVQVLDPPDRPAGWTIPTTLTLTISNGGKFVMAQFCRDRTGAIQMGDGTFVISGSSSASHACAGQYADPGQIDEVFGDGTATWFASNDILQVHRGTNWITFEKM